MKKKTNKEKIEIKAKGIDLEEALRPYIKRYSYEEQDEVNNPKHYTNGNIECIDAMQSAYGTEAVKHFCLCNAFKYLWRCEQKGNTSLDLNKAKWYIDKYLKLSDL